MLSERRAPGRVDRRGDACSFAPVIVNRLAIARMVRPKHEELQTLAARLKRPGYLGIDADRVQRPDVGDLVVKLEASGPAEDHVDLLGARMAVRER